MVIPHWFLFLPWSCITDLEELVSGIKISFKKCDCFDTHCFVEFCFYIFAISSVITCISVFYVSILIFFFFFYICSPNCQLISCNTSENVSPVKQVSRKSPSDTEGLVKSLPSGSHQVTADCGLPTVPCAAVWCCVVFWDAEKNHTKL